MKILSNFILGFIFGILVYKFFLLDIYNKKFDHGPNSNDIKKITFQKGDKYYQFNTQICPCPI